MTRLIAVLLFCAGIFCLAAEPPVGQSHAQVPMTGAGLGAPSGGACSFPSLSNLVGRYKANDPGVTVVNGVVTSVLDLSGHGNNLIPLGTLPGAGNGDVPFNATSAYNGLPAFDFTEADQGALFTTVPATLPSSTSLSAFFVGRMTTNTDNFGGAVVLGVGTSADFNDPGNIAALTRNGTTSAAQTFYNNGAFSISGAISPATNMRLGVVISGGTATEYLNGSSIATAGSSTISLTSPNNIIIGGRWVAGGAPGFPSWDGPMLEIVVTSSDITSQVGALDTYFTCSYGS